MTSTPVPTVFLSLTAVLGARDSLTRSVWTLRFSCNSRGDIWPRLGPGLSLDRDREITPRLTTALGPCASALLRVCSAGGRFTLDVRGCSITRDADGSLVAHVRWTA